jgi:hypothetical protein
MVCKLGLGLGSQRALRKALCGVEHLEEMAGKLRNVLAPRLEARHGDRDDIEPVKEFGPEPTGRNLGGEIAGRRGEHAHVDAHGVRATHPLECLIDQHAQNL